MPLLVTLVFVRAIPLGVDFGFGLLVMMMMMMMMMRTMDNAAAGVSALDGWMGAWIGLARRFGGGFAYTLRSEHHDTPFRTSCIGG